MLLKLLMAGLPLFYVRHRTPSVLCVQELQEAFERSVELVIFVDHIDFYDVPELRERRRGGPRNPVLLNCFDIVFDLLEQLSLEF